MEKGYVKNGFIVDLANATKTSEIIYELSRILDMPEAKNKKVCLKYTVLVFFRIFAPRWMLYTYKTALNLNPNKILLPFTARPAEGHLVVV